MSSQEEGKKQALKRTHTEYQDPDYMNKEEPASKYQRGCHKAIGSTTIQNEQNDDIKRRKYKKLCEIITREFQKEIVFRSEQLEKIDERLHKALKLLDRLRYAIVADYYRKEELILTPADEVMVRGPQTLFDDEPHGIQKPLHPAVRKLVSKKPKIHNQMPSGGSPITDYSLDQTELSVIDKNNEEDVNESRVNISNEKTHQLLTKPLEDIKRRDAKSSNPLKPQVVVKSLNAARLNNKTKVLIVVGNTSKYIGNDVERDHRPNKPLSYKWLIYVQAKENIVPLEQLLRKVRFFLHSSYKPNDVVDVCSPPFQLSRRGWGEFPVRIQLFFKDSFQQKPIQLIHNLVLDKTLCGIQTLGSETLVEIWLRLGLIEGIQTISKSNGTQNTVLNRKNSIDSKSFADNANKCKIETKRKSIDMKSNDFSVDINATPHSSIGPALLHLNQEVQINQSSREQKCSKNTCDSPEIKTKIPSINNNKPVACGKSETAIVIPSSQTTKKTIEGTPVHSIETDGNTEFLQMLVGDIASSVSSMTNSAEVNNATDIINKSKNFFSSKPNCKVITKSEENFIQNTLDKSIIPVGTKLTKPNFAGNIIPSLKNCLNSSAKKQTKNTIFLKEGKIYIVDPLQIKLKQQQKKQVSLLKPQNSLIRQNIPQQIPTLLDHDYVCGPIINPATAIKEVRENEQMNRSPSSQMVVAPRVHLGLKETRALTNNYEEIAEKKHLALEQQFLAQTFMNCQQAVEYLLRRLPLITRPQRKEWNCEDTLSLLYNSSQYFNELPAIKQRALEWLRAKTIAKALRAHKDLQNLNDPLHSSEDILWTTREIIIFARQHAYTPVLKIFKEIKNKINEEKDEKTCLTNLIKCELKNTKEYSYETLTKNICISKWIEDISKSSKIHEFTIGENDDIDVVSTTNSSQNKLIDCCSQNPSKFSINQDTIYLSCPNDLEHPFQLVNDICKDIGLHLKPEELSSGVIQPVSRTILAVCLRFFIEKLLRNALGFKTQKYSTKALPLKNCGNYLYPEDIEKVIGAINEFDFLSNRHLGTSKSFDLKM